MTLRKKVMLAIHEKIICRQRRYISSFKHIFFTLRSPKLQTEKTKIKTVVLTMFRVLVKNNPAKFRSSLFWDPGAKVISITAKNVRRVLKEPYTFY